MDTHAYRCNIGSMWSTAWTACRIDVRESGGLSQLVREQEASAEDRAQKATVVSQSIMLKTSLVHLKPSLHTQKPPADHQSNVTLTQRCTRRKRPHVVISRVYTIYHAFQPTYLYGLGHADRELSDACNVVIITGNLPTPE